MSPVLFCPGFVVARVCRGQGLSCPGFVLPRVCRVQGLSCPGFVRPGFVCPGFVGVSIYELALTSWRIFRGRPRFLLIVGPFPFLGPFQSFKHGPFLSCALGPISTAGPFLASGSFRSAGPFQSATIHTSLWARRTFPGETNCTYKIHLVRTFRTRMPQQLV
jgi:hypothetical protein